MNEQIPNTITATDTTQAAEVSRLYMGLFPEARDYANRACKCLTALDIKGMGAISAAELAVKVTKWLLEHSKKENK